MMANYRQDFALKRTSKWMRRTGFARYGWDLNTDIGLCWLLGSSVQKIDSAVILQLHVCLPFHLQERSGRSLTLPLTKKPHAYEKNTLHLPNTLREAPWKASCRALKNTSWQKDPPGSLE